MTPIRTGLRILRTMLSRPPMPDSDQSNRWLSVCRPEAVPEGGSRGFSVAVEEGGFELFIVRRSDRLYAYLNCCPHTGGPLDWVPDQFLNLDGDCIQCATHDALFRIEDGYCIAGPCRGRSLTAITLRVDADGVKVLPPSRAADEA